MNNEKGLSLSEELSGSEFGDKRLNTRLSKIVEAASRRPGESFPEISNSVAELEATYRFLSNPKVSPEQILRGHILATTERASRAARTVIAHDTTDFIFGGSERREGLGWVTNDNQGFRAHFALALSRADSIYPLGTLGFETIFRTGKAKGVNGGKKKGGHLESSRWWSLAHAVENLFPEEVHPIHVMDREADNYELLSELAGQQMRFVIRVKYDRNDCVHGESQCQGKLSEIAQGLKVRCERDVVLAKREASRFPQDQKVYGTRRARRAKLYITAFPMEMPRPQSANEFYPKSLQLNCVHAYEINAPEGTEPVHWKLLTQESIDTVDDVLNIIDDYRARWTIEEFFKALKSGCAYPKRQLESRESLLNALAVFVPIAWQLLVLRTLAQQEPELPARCVLTRSQVEVLVAVSKKPITESPTIAEALGAIARLGGHIPNNGTPGWQVLARGMEKLLIMEIAWNAALKRCDQS